MKIRRILAALAVTALGIVPIYATATASTPADVQAACLKRGPC